MRLKSISRIRWHLIPLKRLNWEQSHRIKIGLLRYPILQVKCSAHLFQYSCVNNSCSYRLIKPGQVRTGFFKRKIYLGTPIFAIQTLYSKQRTDVFCTQYYVSKTSPASLIMFPAWRTDETEEKKGRIYSVTQAHRVYTREWNAWREKAFLGVKESRTKRFLFHSADPRGIAYREFQPSYDIFRRSGAKGCLHHRFCAPPAYTAQLLTLFNSTEPTTSIERHIKSCQP